MKNKLESLLIRGSDWQNNACLNFTPNVAYGYIHGYKCAADSLVTQIIQTRSNQDILVFPIVFLYRHYLELALKYIIADGRKLLGEKGSFPTHHKIEHLWPLAKGILRKIWSGSEPKEVELIDHLIKELSIIDPDSMSFRYPENLEGKNSLPNIKHINLRHLGQTIDQVGDFLEAVHMGISEYLNERYDF
ncbi:MAG TPA: hypothetical protein PLP22_02680 [Candidatus Competibacter sp.]|nr:hypothetical protein [Candidatus Competibacter sp.]HUM94314.1 hypothetical protein [Candidatus Competibacter sp.]